MLEKQMTKEHRQYLTRMSDDKTIGFYKTLFYNRLLDSVECTIFKIELLANGAQEMLPILNCGAFQFSDMTDETLYPLEDIINER